MESFHGVKGKDRADRSASEANVTNGRRLGKVLSVEELETLPAGTKPGASHHRWPGGERRGKRKRSTISPDRTEKERAIVSQTNVGTV